MVEKSMTCVKYLLFAFNLLFFLFGILLIAFGAYVQVALSDYLDFASSNISGPAVLLIIVGVVTLMVSFFGCCGAIKEHYCMTMTFAVLVGILLICEFAAGIAAYVLRGKVQNIFNDGMVESMETYNSDKATRETWDTLQMDNNCCGANNYSEWMNVPGFGTGDLPNSCCTSNNDQCSTNSTDIKPKGCTNIVESYFTNKISIVAGAGVGLAVIELIGIILSCCLARAIRSQYEIA